VEEAARGERVSLIGSSLGGYLSALYAARHPEVDRVVLLAPAFEFARRFANRIGPAEMLRWKLEGSIDIYHYVDLRERPLGYQLMEDAVLYEEYPDVRQPALIFHGNYDEVVPPLLSERFADGRSNVVLELVDSGHDLHNVLDYMGDHTVQFLAS
jgi:pimeloyl-ACP methyl ester carboxylesterase